MPFSRFFWSPMWTKAWQSRQIFYFQFFMSVISINDSIRIRKLLVGLLVSFHLQHDSMKVWLWTRKLGDGIDEFATAILNFGDYGAPINASIPIRDMGVNTSSGIFDVEDVFLQIDYWDYNMDQVFYIEVPPNSVAFLHLYPSELRKSKGLDDSLWNIRITNSHLTYLY